MRAPTERAATRRGWVWPMTPSTPRPRLRQIFGSCVVLPEPVSPQTMTTWCFSMACANSSRRATTGRSAGYSIAESCWMRARRRWARGGKAAFMARDFTCCRCDPLAKQHAWTDSVRLGQTECHLPVSVLAQLQAVACLLCPAGNLVQANAQPILGSHNGVQQPAGDPLGDGAAAVADAEAKRLDRQRDGHGDAGLALALFAGVVDEIVGDAIEQRRGDETAVEPMRHVPDNVPVR